ncbi:MAG: hypothetical protein ACR2HN_05770 [Tepidiformaceae bacterium]
MRRWLFMAAVVLAGVATTGSMVDNGVAEAEPPLVVVVTSAGDSELPEEAVCPDEALCTLRRAIEFVNPDESGNRYTITFDAGVFPPGAPTTIAVLAGQLPVTTRGFVTIDGSAAGVVIDGAALPQPADGLVISGKSAVVMGLTLRNFGGTCLAVSGEEATIGGSRIAAEGIAAGGCGTGIEASGPGATVTGNTVGFAADGAAAAVVVGLHVRAGGIVVGGDAAALMNVIGNAGTAIRVGGGDGRPPFTGTVVLRNTIGRSAAGTAAPVGAGVQLLQPGSGATINGNTFANVTGAAVAVAADSGGVTSAGNVLRRNVFTAIGGLAIDLNADGILNANDAGDADSGGNTLLNHPVFTRPVQGHIAGNAGACAGCAVELYTVSHTPGGAGDHPTAPVLTGIAITDGAGAFTFSNPPVALGQWVTGTVTDGAGNTSEFGPPTRVGSGVVQCGNITLRPGWNHAGFFGSSPATLGSAYPANLGLPSRVRSIYRLRDGEGAFDRWFTTGNGQTLSALQPGEAYWFDVESEVEIAGGFSLTVPFPVELKAGWNEFVYIGATADVRDALISIASKYTNVYRFVNDAAGPRWGWWGRPETPAWAREFDQMQACTTYQVFMTEDATLTPLQP